MTTLLLITKITIVITIVIIGVCLIVMGPERKAQAKAVICKEVKAHLPIVIIGVSGVIFATAAGLIIKQIIK
ncbi:hypothetical protein [Ruminococcus flavefaciens]|uniref:hypothetical protein n=1 Tax=Ruminococcus flavefaciens TaxID=1265 RepID=UPI0026F317E7|nr:hypothetical protein [Ruminococcus flavefaciens]